MRKTDSGIWIPEKLGKQRERTGRKWPSVSTVNTFISIPVSLIALFLSIRGYRINNESLVLGQRAYVSISNGQLEVAAIRREKKPVYTTNDVVIKYEVNCQFVLQNLGNTPADVSSLRLEYYTPKHWEDELTNMMNADVSIYANPLEPRRPKTNTESLKAAPKKKERERITPASYSRQIGPKAVITFHLPTTWYPISTSRAEAGGTKDDKPDPIEVELDPVILKGSLTYKDVFSLEHSVQWCWVVNGYATRFPKECSDATQKDLVRRKLTLDPEPPLYDQDSFQ